MEITPFDGTIVNTVVTGMVVDDVVLGGVSHIWKGGMFVDSGSNVIGQVCVDYYKTHNKAPGKDIEGLMAVWAENNSDKTTSRLISERLDHLSRVFERSDGINSSHVLDIANKLFKKNSLTKMFEKGMAKILKGDVESAESMVIEYSKMDINAGYGVDLFIDREAVKRVYTRSNRDPVFYYPGELGKLLNIRMHYNAFVTFIAPEKTGKTWVLVDAAYRAMTSRKRVAFFEVGDESEEEINDRFLVRAAGIPSYSPDGTWPYTVDYPISIKRPARGSDEDDRVAEIVHKQLTFDVPLDEDVAWKACRRVMKKYVKSRESYYRLSVHPTIDMAGIRSILDSWKITGWDPDVVIIDYADNIAPSSKYKDFRHQTNEIWKGMRELSLERHCLLITATQGDRKSYDAVTIGRRNITEDKRKWSHVTCGIGINVIGEEKSKGLIRFNIVLGRKGGFSPNYCVHVATCLPLGEPIVLTC